MLSVIIPARNEKYLGKTIDNILENARGEIEVIAELDGWLPEPPLQYDERVVFVHHKEAIGQRACINHGASIAKGEYIMKLDAHCAVGEGFDVILARDCKYEWTLVPTMYNLDIGTFKPKLHKRTDYMYIGCSEGRLLRAEYYGSRQPKSNKQIDETMCCMGPGWFMHKKRFFEQGGCDESHEGGWGQQGVEVSCKAWLSGGALMVDKNTWFAHWFRGGGGPGFPYPISGNTIERVRRYSRDLWLNDKWDKQVRSFKWLVDKFDPPGWTTDLTILYYTANVVHHGIEYSVLRSLRGVGLPIISVSQKPMELGKNIVVPEGRSYEKIYQQVLIGAKAANTEYVALCEDDCLYVPEHFKYRPKKPFGYNLNRWLLHLDDKVWSYRERPILSQCIAHRETLIECLEKGDRTKEMGVMKDGYEYETFKTKEPNMVICHKDNTKRAKKLLGKDAEPRQEVKPWGTVEYWIDKFEKRGVFK